MNQFAQYVSKTPGLERSRDIFVSVLRGERYDDVALRYGLSRSRIDQFFSRICRCLKGACIRQKNHLGGAFLPVLDESLINLYYLKEMRPHAERLIELYDYLIALPDPDDRERTFPEIGPDSQRPAYLCQSCNQPFMSNFKPGLCYDCTKCYVQLVAIVQSFPEE